MQIGGLKLAWLVCTLEGSVYFLVVPWGWEQLSVETGMVWYFLVYTAKCIFIYILLIQMFPIIVVLEGHIFQSPALRLACLKLQRIHVTCTWSIFSVPKSMWLKMRSTCLRERMSSDVLRHKSKSLETSPDLMICLGLVMHQQNGWRRQNLVFVVAAGFGWFIYTLTYFTDLFRLIFFFLCAVSLAWKYNKQRKKSQLFKQNWM